VNQERSIFTIGPEQEGHNCQKFNYPLSFKKKSFACCVIMFLQRQLFFYEFYFSLVDFLKLTVLTYDARQQIFKLKFQPKWNKLIYFLLLSNFVYMLRGTYLFAKLFVEKSSDPLHVLNMSLHTLALAACWCCVLFRSKYTLQTKSLLELMNSMLKLEKSCLQSKST